MANELLYSFARATVVVIAQKVIIPAAAGVPRKLTGVLSRSVKSGFTWLTGGRKVGHLHKHRLSLKPLY